MGNNTSKLRKYPQNPKTPFEWEIIDYLNDNHSIKTRDNHTAVIFYDYMFIFGGFIDGDRTNQVLIYDF